MNQPRSIVRRTASPLGRWRAIWRDALALLLSLSDRRSGAPAKLLAAAALLYALSPIDLIPDGLPVLGVTDDLLIVPAVLAFAARRMPAPVLAQARGKVARLPQFWLAVLGGALALGVLIWAATRLLGG
ncbi:hypothetical protein DKM44_01355 [Deinococcus irradiatisoli]|uniref:DUF1232 domain-containing protein n=1 Tax=Deinococcus irradiatisoli TaxID=2202254 RepID=A0A2Z3JGI8_9DEIO|nr:DUF1232 domain-containing protein [Deinococcus irradiatisoli]AWN22049.1 hypothetical protein DKM44_01355 [Deinococcus irradiatisoli]